MHAHGDPKHRNTVCVCVCAKSMWHGGRKGYGVLLFVFRFYFLLLAQIDKREGSAESGGKRSAGQRSAGE